VCLCPFVRFVRRALLLLLLLVVVVVVVVRACQIFGDGVLVVDARDRVGVCMPARLFVGGAHNGAYRHGRRRHTHRGSCRQRYLGTVNGQHHGRVERHTQRHQPRFQCSGELCVPLGMSVRCAYVCVWYVMCLMCPPYICVCVVCDVSDVSDGSAVHMCVCGMWVRRAYVCVWYVMCLMCLMCLWVCGSAVHTCVCGM
jgi:hypothetical protein